MEKKLKLKKKLKNTINLKLEKKKCIFKNYIYTSKKNYLK